MFLVNSRLGCFTAAPFLEHPFSLSYGVILQSSLAIVLSAHLVILSLPMCVHFRYGPMCVVLEAFPGSLLSAFPYLPKLSVCIAPSPYAHRISLVRRYLACPSYSSSLVARAFSVTPSPHIGYGNIHLSSIGYAFRPRLRSRLSQRGRAFLWRPWAIGAWDSHPRAATHAGILSSMRSTCPPGHASPPHAMLPYHIPVHSFGVMLSPVNYRRRVIRLVSCYALFEGWSLLSQPPSCLHVSTSFST